MVLFFDNLESAPDIILKAPCMAAVHASPIGNFLPKLHSSLVVAARDMNPAMVWILTSFTELLLMN